MTRKGCWRNRKRIVLFENKDFSVPAEIEITPQRREVSQIPYVMMNMGIDVVVRFRSNAGRVKRYRLVLERID